MSVVEAADQNNSIRELKDCECNADVDQYFLVGQECLLGYWKDTQGQTEEEKALECYQLWECLIDIASVSKVKSEVFTDGPYEHENKL